jgi:hypothetical protein
MMMMMIDDDDDDDDDGGLAANLTVPNCRYLYFWSCFFGYRTTTLANGRRFIIAALANLWLVE